MALQISEVNSLIAELDAIDILLDRLPARKPEETHGVCIRITDHMRAWLEAGCPDRETWAGNSQRVREIATERERRRRGEGVEQDEPLLLHFRGHHSPGGITRQELEEIAEFLGEQSETRVVHMALSRMYFDLFPPERETTEEEFMAAGEPEPQGALGPSLLAKVRATSHSLHAELTAEEFMAMGEKVEGQEVIAHTPFGLLFQSPKALPAMEPCPNCGQNPTFRSSDGPTPILLVHDEHDAPNCGCPYHATIFHVTRFFAISTWNKHVETLKARQSDEAES